MVKVLIAETMHKDLAYHDACDTNKVEFNNHYDDLTLGYSFVLNLDALSLRYRGWNHSKRE